MPIFNFVSCILFVILLHELYPPIIKNVRKGNLIKYKWNCYSLISRERETKRTIKLNMQHHWQREEKYLVIYHIILSPIDLDVIIVWCER